MTDIKRELDNLRRVCRNRHEITPDALDAYAEVLDDLPAELVTHACRDMRLTSTDFPAASEIRTRVIAMQAGVIFVNVKGVLG